MCHVHVSSNQLDKAKGSQKADKLNHACVTFGVYKVWRVYFIDGYSALGVVYEVSLEVVLTTHAWCAGDAGIAIWRARLFAAH